MCAPGGLKGLKIAPFWGHKLHFTYDLTSIWLLGVFDGSDHKFEPFKAQKCVFCALLAILSSSGRDWGRGLWGESGT